MAALVRLGGARRNMHANTRGSGSAVRTKREADGGMRAVAVVGSKGKVGSRRWLLWNGHAALVIGSTRDERLRRPWCVGARDR